MPISAWTAAEPPRIMGQALKKADRLGIWYLHVWTWEPSPSGLFADWNPNVKCGGASSKHPDLLRVALWVAKTRKSDESKEIPEPRPALLG